MRRKREKVQKKKREGKKGQIPRREGHARKENHM